MSHFNAPAPTERESPPVAKQAGSEQQIQIRTERSATPRKWQRVLRAFVDGRSLNRFEAARELRDWVLPTTVSQLERRGILIFRHDETVPGAYGPVHCCRYRIAPASVALGHELLSRPTAHPEVERAMEPTS